MILIISMILLVSALDTELIPNAVNNGFTLSNINAHDASFETIDKNEVLIINYTTQSCDSINSAEVCLDIWSQDVPSSETVTFDCSVDGSNWNNCGVNTWTPAASKTTYCYVMTGVTCGNLADFQSRLTSNDGAQSDDFYLDFTNITLDYEVAAAPENCWSIITGGIYVPQGCTYYIEGGTTGYIT